MLKKQQRNNAALHAARIYTNRFCAVSLFFVVVEIYAFREWEFVCNINNVLMVHFAFVSSEVFG